MYSDPFGVGADLGGELRSNAVYLKTFINTPHTPVTPWSDIGGPYFQTYRSTRTCKAILRRDVCVDGESVGGAVEVTRGGHRLRGPPLLTLFCLHGGRSSRVRSCRSPHRSRVFIGVHSIACKIK